MIFQNEEILENAFNYFREKGFPYRELPLHMCMQEINKLAELEDDKLLTSNLGYKVADTYHPHRFHSKVHNMKSPYEGFCIDKILKRSLKRRLEYGTGIKKELLGGVGGIAITSGVQGCSNFRPAFALKLYREFCTKDSNILDTSAGYGGRLVGFIAFDGGHYIGVDPDRNVCLSNKRMSYDLNVQDRVAILESPVEDLDPEIFSEEFDFAFTSPPYYKKEQYSNDATQSWVRYETGEDWASGFLYPMLVFQYKSLKNGAYNCINMSDVKLGSKTYPLIAWCVAFARDIGFTLKQARDFSLQKRIGSGHETTEIAKETVLIFKK